MKKVIFKQDDVKAISAGCIDSNDYIGVVPRGTDKKQMLIAVNVSNLTTFKYTIMNNFFVCTLTPVSFDSMIDYLERCKYEIFVFDSSYDLIKWMINENEG